MAFLPSPLSPSLEKLDVDKLIISFSVKHWELNKITYLSALMYWHVPCTYISLHILFRKQVSPGNNWMHSSFYSDKYTIFLCEYPLRYWFFRDSCKFIESNIRQHCIYNLYIYICIYVYIFKEGRWNTVIIYIILLYYYTIYIDLYYMYIHIEKEMKK